MESNIISTFKQAPTRKIFNKKLIYQYLYRKNHQYNNRSP